MCACVDQRHKSGIILNYSSTLFRGTVSPSNSELANVACMGSRLAWTGPLSLCSGTAVPDEPPDPPCTSVSPQDLNCDPHTCMGSALTTEPPPWPCIYFAFEKSETREGFVLCRISWEGLSLNLAGMKSVSPKSLSPPLSPRTVSTGDWGHAWLFT